MRFFRGKVPSEPDIVTQQEKLRSLSGEVLRRYQAELNAEISDPARLAVVYGQAFAGADARRQAEVVAKMATGMLKVPNAAINVLNDHTMDSVAMVVDYEIVDDDALLHEPVPETYCQHVIATGREMAVANALEHPLVCNTTMARGGMALSYLGVPVANRDTIIVGTLCVFDTIERAWSTMHVSMLTQLSVVLTRALP